MKKWLLDRYAASTFNTCPHRALPSMEGPPIEIHIDPSATPKVCHTPAPVPLHWQQQVHDDRLCDEALGVIERVPYGEPTTWCHRMVITRNHNGSPRRTVDLLPLNKYCQRGTFAMVSPFHLAARILRNTGLEEFCCLLYGHKKTKQVDEVREIKLKNLCRKDGSIKPTSIDLSYFPPCQRSLSQHKKEPITKQQYGEEHTFQIQQFLLQQLAMDGW